MIGLAEEPLRIQWTPEFMRSFGGAMLDSPGPLDAGQQAFFSITPVRDEWSADEVESYLREMNTRQMRLLTVHEAVPGHYLQGAYCNRGASLARRVFQSGLFAEGWAVYVTQVMLDLGYGDGDPALWLVHWKFYLRAVVNAIIDVRIHTMGMTSEEAIALMVDGGFQEHAEALAKDERAPTVVDPAGHVLPGLGRDVGDRGRACAGRSRPPRAPAPERSRRRASWAATARRPASTSAPTSRTRSRMARRPSRSCGGSCSTDPRRRVPGGCPDGPPAATTRVRDSDRGLLIGARDQRATARVECGHGTAAEPRASDSEIRRRDQGSDGGLRRSPTGRAAARLTGHRSSISAC